MGDGKPSSRNAERIGIAGKRCLDLLASASALAILSPLMVAIAVVVRMSSPGKIIFRQTRIGLDGRPFSIWKFRTMNEKKDRQGNRLPDAARLTGVGGWLRRWSLDELPELFNVLKGDMSLVGPRPLLPQYLDRYTPEQARRHEVKPGLTGWAQVNGRNALSWEEKFALDVWYVDHRSFWLDVKIILMTLFKVIKREGINAEGEATMPEFTGAPSPRAKGKNA